MNPVDHPHGGGEGKHRVEEAQFHHGSNQPKVLKQENQKK